ncbi:hypothetical protein PT279_08750, partial [Bifidobacterium sp. ESL0784]|uniref:hypothetical protein n=1 Tax=Bifidobacterium sp. ESL0784 TaxID=2983231 RepID=UPI0023F781E0
RQQGEQQAARLEDKIRRLHTLDQTTRHLYQDTTPPTGNNSDTVMDEVVNGDMDQEQLTAFFEKTMHLSHEDAAALAEFTSRFRDYAKKTHLTDKEAVDSYAIILASTSYGGAMWTTAAGTLTNKQLVALLGLMGYKDGKGPGSAQYFISQMFNMHKTDGKNRDSIDFIHEMASLACILNTAPGGLIYHLSGTDVEDQPQFRLHGPLFDKYPWLNSEADDRSDEIATWSGDIASGAGGRADWNADMDAVNIHRAMKANPKESPRKAADDYYTSIGRGDTERNRARRFCAGYDPTGSNDPQKGLKWLEDNAAYLSTASPGAHLLKDRFQATTDQQDKAREDFLSTLRQEIK